jgi:hypothetical protein
MMQACHGLFFLGFAMCFAVLDHIDTVTVRIMEFYLVYNHASAIASLEKDIT